MTNGYKTMLAVLLRSIPSFGHELYQRTAPNGRFAEPTSGWVVEHGLRFGPTPHDNRRGVRELHVERQMARFAVVSEHSVLRRPQSATANLDYANYLYVVTVSHCSLLDGVLRIPALQHDGVVGRLERGGGRWTDLHSLRACLSRRHERLNRQHRPLRERHDARDGGL